MNIDFLDGHNKFQIRYIIFDDHSIGGEYYGTVYNKDYKFIGDFTAKNKAEIADYFPGIFDNQIKTPRQVKERVS